MDIQCAPESLLQIVHCNCQTDCSSMRCVCKKNGLRYTYIRGSCQVEGYCCNIDVIVYIHDDDLSDD